MTKTLEFFFDFTSPYAYLASTQVEAVAERTGATLRYRPFLLGAVFKATGNSPPLMVPAKGLHMLKDLGRWAEHYGLPPFALPSPFPFRSLEANRLALVAIEAGKGKEFVARTYRAGFVEHAELSDRAVLARLATEVGLNAEEALAKIEQPSVKDALRANTEEAVARGSFGAPTFFVGDELFVGNDRLHFVERALREG